jgi:hypothetical protein
MQGQLFTQDFLTRGATETPAYLALSDAVNQLRQTLTDVFSGLNGIHPGAKPRTRYWWPCRTPCQ